MDDFKKQINSLSDDVKNLKNLLKIDEKKSAVSRLQEEMSGANFWQDQKEASAVVSKLKNLKNDVDDWEVLFTKLKDLEELAVISDESYSKDLAGEVAKLQTSVKDLKLRILFSERFDDCSAIVEINSGAGGTEACDWASMLYRMYVRWAESKKFKISVLEELAGEEAGIKNITFLIEGLRAYGLLKSERGVHRLVRISPFDANKRRHTSFASVDVIPQIQDEVDIEIKPEELKIDTFRASGAGGQHVNKTESAIRITHLPTGIIVGCQSERSQHQNKQVALNVLKAKLYEIREEEKKKQMEKISGTKKRIEWGSQIRSYVLHPYLLVKDHRTDVESGDAWGVLDGKLDNFMHAYLKAKVEGKV